MTLAAIFRGVLLVVLEDDSFLIPSTEATRVLQVAINGPEVPASQTMKSFALNIVDCLGKLINQAKVGEKLSRQQLCRLSPFKQESGSDFESVW